MKSQGIFIVSLDFELNWGVHDVFTLDEYYENLLGVREAIPRMLTLFEEFGIHATWATVGLLFFGEKKELMSNLPPIYPNYRISDLSPYGKLESIGENEEDDPIHFGYSLLKQITACPNQEIASHTFSHYYCLEKGQTEKEFNEDLKVAVKVADLHGHKLKSLVFPRNQINTNYLHVCRENGFHSYRGCEKGWVYKPSPFRSESSIKRLLRLCDSYINLFGHHTYPISKVAREPLVNLPSSGFLRPYTPHLKMLERLRIRRIKNSMTNAAKKGEVYHLWWHPHNFGKNIDENIRLLYGILSHVTELRDLYGFQSLTMEEATVLVRDFDEEIFYKNEFVLNNKIKMK